MVAVYQNTPARHAKLSRAVDAERDRRTDAGFWFLGHKFQTSKDSRENIMGAATLALIAETRGAQAGDYDWHPDPDLRPFAFLTEDNTPVPMDAPTAIAFGEAAATHKSRLIFAARTIKDMAVIPADVTNDALWTPPT